MSNRAITFTAFGGTDNLKLTDIPVPQAQSGAVVVRVKAAGINGLDWKIREGYMRDVMPTVFPAVLGQELAGEVVAVAPGSGAFADYVAVPEATLAHTPQALSDTMAAALPTAGLTASQILSAAGPLEAGQTVLVHGAAGGVGTILVQLARQMGLKIIATASGSSHAHLATLGVDRIIDRQNERFEDIAGKVDSVIDLAGGDAPDRSWNLLRTGGALISSVRPDVAAPREDGRRGIWFFMQPDTSLLGQLADSVVSGNLKLTLAEIVRLEDVLAALERNRTGHKPGKAVADLTLD